MIDLIITQFFRCLGEEGLFRYAIITWFCNKNLDLIGIVVSILLYANVHWILFRYPMVIASGVLGIPLAMFFYYIPAPWGFLASSALHIGAGYLCYRLGYTERWQRTLKLVSCLKKYFNWNWYGIPF
jgi:membrane protease YdiL (CAAX protease family)